MTKDQKKQMKILCYVNWLLAEKYNGHQGLRDIDALKEVLELPGGGSLTCLTGDRLTNRKDLYSQLGWFVYYMLENEPFESKNISSVLLMLLWCLEHYKLKYKMDSLLDFIINLDPMRQGNTDISIWFSNNCK